MRITNYTKKSNTQSHTLRNIGTNPHSIPQPELIDQVYIDPYLHGLFGDDYTPDYSDYDQPLIPHFRDGLPDLTHFVTTQVHKMRQFPDRAWRFRNKIILYILAMGYSEQSAHDFIKVVCPELIKLKNEKMHGAPGYGKVISEHKTEVIVKEASDYIRKRRIIKANDHQLLSFSSQLVNRMVETGDLSSRLAVSTAQVLFGLLKTVNMFNSFKFSRSYRKFSTDFGMCYRVAHKIMIKVFKMLGLVYVYNKGIECTEFVIDMKMLAKYSEHLDVTFLPGVEDEHSLRLLSHEVIVSGAEMLLNNLLELYNSYDLDAYRAKKQAHRNETVKFVFGKDRFKFEMRDKRAVKQVEIQEDDCSFEVLGW